ncbi:hypothetical protein DIPPA_03940 [Diplonema papillatum]|nr:hypothetical protein DIPPA_03940 [Diplonema papillatum]KAJ9450807.1 hypothetical protein DIPPA_03940 [Diplonema papillatum]
MEIEPHQQQPQHQHQQQQQQQQQQRTAVCDVPPRSQRPHGGDPVAGDGAESCGLAGSDEPTGLSPTDYTSDDGGSSGSAPGLREGEAAKLSHRQAGTANSTPEAVGHSALRDEAWESTDTSDDEDDADRPRPSGVKIEPSPGSKRPHPTQGAVFASAGSNAPATSPPKAGVTQSMLPRDPEGTAAPPPAAEGGTAGCDGPAAASRGRDPAFSNSGNAPAVSPAKAGVTHPRLPRDPADGTAAEGGTAGADDAAAVRTHDSYGQDPAFTSSGNAQVISPPEAGVPQSRLQPAENTAGGSNTRAPPANEGGTAGTAPACTHESRGQGPAFTSSGSAPSISPAKGGVTQSRLPREPAEGTAGGGNTSAPPANGGGPASVDDAAAASSRAVNVAPQQAAVQGAGWDSTDTSDDDSDGQKPAAKGSAATGAAPQPRAAAARQSDDGATSSSNASSGGGGGRPSGAGAVAAPAKPAPKNVRAQAAAAGWDSTTDSSDDDQPPAAPEAPPARSGRVGAGVPAAELAEEGSSDASDENQQAKIGRTGAAIPAVELAGEESSHASDDSQVREPKQEEVIAKSSRVGAAISAVELGEEESADASDEDQQHQNPAKSGRTGAAVELAEEESTDASDDGQVWEPKRQEEATAKSSRVGTAIPAVELAEEESTDASDDDQVWEPKRQEEATAKSSRVGAAIPAVELAEEESTDASDDGQVWEPKRQEEATAKSSRVGAAIPAVELAEEESTDASDDDQHPGEAGHHQDPAKSSRVGAAIPTVKLAEEESTDASDDDQHPGEAGHHQDPAKSSRVGAAIPTVKLAEEESAEVHSAVVNSNSSAATAAIIGNKSATATNRKADNNNTTTANATTAYSNGSSNGNSDNVNNTTTTNTVYNTTATATYGSTTSRNGNNTFITNTTTAITTSSSNNGSTTGVDSNSIAAARVPGASAAADRAATRAGNGKEDASAAAADDAPPQTSQMDGVMLTVSQLVKESNSRCLVLSVSSTQVTELSPAHRHTVRPYDDGSPATPSPATRPAKAADDDASSASSRGDNDLDESTLQASSSRLSFSLFPSIRASTPRSPNPRSMNSSSVFSRLPRIPSKFGEDDRASADEYDDDDGIDWEAVCRGLGLVGESNTEVDDMVWFVERGVLASKALGRRRERASVRRRTEPDTWLCNDPAVQLNWKNTLYLNLITNWRFELVVATVSPTTGAPQTWTKRRVFASPQRAVCGVKDQAKEVKYEDTFPEIYFNIEDWNEAFTTLRVCPKTVFTVELAALTGADGRVSVTKGRLAYNVLAKRFQYNAGGPRLNHVEHITVNGEKGSVVDLAIQIAPEEESEQAIELKRGSSYLSLSQAQNVGGTPQPVLPKLQCALIAVHAPVEHVALSILRLATESDRPYVTIPVFAVDPEPVTLSPVPTTPSDRGVPSPTSARLPAALAPDAPLPAAVFEPQGLVLAEPADPDMRLEWRTSFAAAPLFVDAVLQCVYHGTVAKRAGKRLLGKQGYQKRVVVVTRDGLMHYFEGSMARTQASGTCYLRGARLSTRTRSSSSASTPFVLEVHSTVPRRPAVGGDRSFHFGFNSLDESTAFQAVVAPFCLLPP